MHVEFRTDTAFKEDKYVAIKALDIAMENSFSKSIWRHWWKGATVIMVQGSNPGSGFVIDLEKEPFVSK